MSIRLLVEALPHAEGLPLPAYETAGAAGFDLRAAIAENSPIKMEKSERTLVPTGLKLQIPEGYEAQVRPRSGLALRHGVTVLNTPGTIDCDYRGEIGVVLINHGDAPFLVTRGMRIAQMVLAPVRQAQLCVVSEIDSTPRGAGGFGSTGL